MPRVDADLRCCCCCLKSWREWSDLRCSSVIFLLTETETKTRIILGMYENEMATISRPRPKCGWRTYSWPQKPPDVQETRRGCS